MYTRWDMHKYARDAYELGVRYIGGCCGVEPHHIRHGCQMAKLDPFLSLDCAPLPSTLAQSKERKGSNFAIWQHCNGNNKMIDKLKNSPSRA